MSTIDELIREVQAAGISIRPDPPDLVLRPADRLTPELEARLKERKTEILKRLELEASMRRLEAANILLAISEDGDLRIVQTEADAHQATLDRFTIYSPQDAYMYVTLSERERRMLHDFKKRFGGTVEWREP